MKTNGTRKSPIQVPVVPEALKAKGKGTEARVARICGVHLVALAKGKRHFLRHGAEAFGGGRGEGL